MTPKPGFDWGRVAWGRPDSPVRPFCAYCHGQLGEDDVPLAVWQDDGSMARFCERCMATWWGFEKEADEGEAA
jgi:hypothetical protein